MQEMIDLPSAGVEDEWTSEETGSRIVRVSTEEGNVELGYIIGQFQERGFEVNSVDFKRTTITFAKNDD